jgi:hypothetical protein
VNTNIPVTYFLSSCITHDGRYKVHKYLLESAVELGHIAALISGAEEEDLEDAEEAPVIRETSD